MCPSIFVVSLHLIHQTVNHSRIYFFLLYPPAELHILGHIHGNARELNKRIAEQKWIVAKRLNLLDALAAELQQAEYWFEPEYANATSLFAYLDTAYKCMAARVAIIAVDHPSVADFLNGRALFLQTSVEGFENEVG